jgi:arginase
MNRRIALIGAASNLGIKTYDDGRPRRVDDAPVALRAAGLAERLSVAYDAGDVFPEKAYHQFGRRPGEIHHETEVSIYCQELAHRVGLARADGLFPLVLGGDCSVLLGALLGARMSGRRDEALALLYLDGHADFATSEESLTGSAASMTLALATGRAGGAPGTLHPRGPLVRDIDVALVGRRDEKEPWYGQEALGSSGVLDLPDSSLRADGGYAKALDRVLDRVAGAPGGFWIHLDADVIDSTVMAAVDSPAPGGATTTDLGRLLAGVVNHPRAVGLDLTIYDPELDPDGRYARELVELLGTAFGDAKSKRGEEEGGRR